MEIDVCIDFQKAEAEVEESRKPPAPSNYEARCVAADVKNSGPNSKMPGRPYINWTVEIINSPDFNGKKIFHMTQLPWANPDTGEIVTSGIGFLVDLTKAMNKPWVGGKLETSDYIGIPFGIRTIVEPDQNGEPRARIKSVHSL